MEGQPERQAEKPHPAVRVDRRVLPDRRKQRSTDQLRMIAIAALCALFLGTLPSLVGVVVITAEMESSNLDARERGCVFFMQELGRLAAIARAERGGPDATPEAAARADRLIARGIANCNRQVE